MEGFGSFAKKKPEKGDDKEKEKEDEKFDMKWKDIKNRHIKKEAGKLLKALDKKEVLAYSAEHGEFSIFKDEMEFIQASKGKGKKMKWVKVESSQVDFKLINRLVNAGIIELIPTTMSEAFSFKGAIKHGFLDKYDKPYVDQLEKKGWEIEEFLLTGKGFEIVIKKGSKRVEYIDKTPSKVLAIAAKKAR